MFDIFFQLIKGFIEILYYPLVLGIGLYAIFSFVCLFFYIRQYLNGRRPEKTHVRYVRRAGLLYSLFILAPRQIVEDYFSKPADFFNPQGLVIFTGRQGRGKTISMVEYMMHLQDTYPLCKCITNLDYMYQDEALEHWRQLISFKNEYKGVVVGMDELQNWFGSNQSKNFPPEMLGVITQNRKNRRIILGTAKIFIS